MEAHAPCTWTAHAHRQQNGLLCGFCTPVTCGSASLADRGSALCTVEEVAGARSAAVANHHPIGLLNELQRCLKEEVEVVVEAARLGVALHKTVLQDTDVALKQRRCEAWPARRGAVCGGPAH